MQGGSLDGLSLDPMGLSHKAISHWKNKFTTNLINLKKMLLMVILKK